MFLSSVTLPASTACPGKTNGIYRKPELRLLGCQKDNAVANRLLGIVQM